MAVSLKRLDADDFPEPLSWTIWNVGMPEQKVIICGDRTELCAMIKGNPAQEWDVAPDGTVMPSVLMRGGPGMAWEWHEFVKLEGWVP